MSMFSEIIAEHNVKMITSSFHSFIEENNFDDQTKIALEKFYRVVIDIVSD